MIIFPILMFGVNINWHARHRAQTELQASSLTAVEVLNIFMSYEKYCPSWRFFL